MMKALLFVFCAMIPFASNVRASETGQEELRLVQEAEEISESVMDDDEKIGRLSQIEARVREIRKRRASSETPPPRPPPGTATASPRPVSTFVQNQARKLVKKPDPEDDDEPEPTPLMRFGFWILRFFGWTIVVGISAAALLFVGIVVTVFLQQLVETRQAPAPRTRASPGNSVARDGMVPERLR